MQKLDRYVSGYFLSSYGVCLLFFMGMFVLIDLFGKSDEIVEATDSLRQMGYSVGPLLIRYYGLLLPFVFLQVAPFVTVMAAMFALTRLRRNNELVPMIVVGRSVFRILAPVFVCSVLLAVFMVLIQEYVAPTLSDSREKARALLFKGEETRLVEGLFPCGDSTYVFVRGYDIITKHIGNFDISTLDTEEAPILGSDARWDPVRQRFVYEEIRGEGEDSAVVERELPEQLTPHFIDSQVRGVHDLSYSQAQYLYDMTGDSKWKVLLHYHLTFPLSNILLLLLALPFVLSQQSRSLMVGMVISILICAAYFAFDAMMRNLGDKDVLHPVLAAWFGVIFFGSLGIVLVDNVRT